MGRNLCLDLFGPPSPDEFAAGIYVHGEASVEPYQITAGERELTARYLLPQARLAFRRHVRLEGQHVLFLETVENLSALDRPIAWTQHVTLGPPFLERGTTLFRAPGTKSRDLGGRLDFEWPLRPIEGGGLEDLQVFTNAESSG